MPFNDRGEYVKDMNPVEVYRIHVIKSACMPGSGGFMWSSEYRNRLHNEAARFILEQEGISPTPENFTLARKRLAREVEDVLQCDRTNCFVKQEPLLPQKPAPGTYKRIGG